MRFTTELLPLLTDQPGVIIEVTGQPADYREAGDSLVLRCRPTRWLAARTGSTSA